ncbi:hypothetical protein [Streptomyces sp. NBC_00057]|uniref:aldose epimerase family protein n=1 Tax=Streptomyces sp. NBC_00057 TaxID=2975634 RepID=UPI00324DC1E3
MHDRCRAFLCWSSAKLKKRIVPESAFTALADFQVYTANRLDGTFADPAGLRHARHSANCLETQHLPDSPNRPDYPSTDLRPGEVARSRTGFRFPHLEPHPA